MDCTPAYDELAKRREGLKALLLDPMTLGEAIEQNESGFQKILEQAPLGYQSLDENGHFLDVNQAWLNTLGYSREEVIGRSFADFLHPDWIDHFKRSFPRFKAIGEILGVEFEMVKKDGTLVYSYVNGRIEYDEKDRFKRTHCIIYDITKRKKREEDLRNAHNKLKSEFNEKHMNLSKAHDNLKEQIRERERVERELCERETRFTDFLENLADMVFELDAWGNIAYINRMVEKVTGLDRKEIVGEPFLPLIAGTSQSKTIKLYQKTLQGESTEIELTLFNGIICHLKGEPLENPKGHITGVLGIARDITESKRAEEAIRRSEERFRTVANFAYNWEYWVDPDGGLLYVSPSCQRISGYGAKEFMDNPLLIYDIVHPDDSEKVRAHIESADTPAENFEFRICTRDGQERWIGHVCQPVFSEEGKFLGRRGSNRDITERKNAERALKESNELLSKILTASGVGIAYAKGRKIEWANEAMSRLFGFSKEEDYLGKDTLMLYASEKEYMRVGRLTYQSRPGEVVETEARFKRHDGSEFFGEVKVNILDPSEPSMGIIVNIMDITERKLAEEAVRESENQYRILTENIADGVTIYQDGRLVFVNPAFAELIGYTAGDLLGKDPIDLVHDDYKERFKQMAQSSDEGIPKIPFQSVCIRKDGREIWTEAYHSIIQWRGEPAFLCTVRDITGHKLHAISMEEEREHLHKENVRLRASIKERYRFDEIIGMSPGMQEVYELIMRAAGTDANVIISGESGTGKELIARTIHETSNRKEMPFVPINCGAVPETLFESEFFGHKKGAFTGAQIDKHGFFDLARGGTLFLDEIGELTLNMQAKLLRAIEGGGYVAVGGREIKHAEARIISATNRNLSDMVQKGLFREDFFYRLHVIPITVPPLRDRKEDIPLLVDHYLNRGNGVGRQIIPAQVLETLYHHRWPGNVRELHNLLQRFITLGRLDFITTKASQENLPADMMVEKFHHGCGALRETMETFERAFISKVLEQNRWHRGKAAKTLAIPERTLYRKLRQYQLNSSESLS